MRVWRNRVDCVRLLSRDGRLWLCVLAAILAVLVGAGSAKAVVVHVFYGHRGGVQLLKTQGSVQYPNFPYVIFPKHWIVRSPLARHRNQWICETEKVTNEVGYPYFNWVIAGTRTKMCAWTGRSDYITVPEWDWQGDYFQAYHARFIVTWQTRKRLLAKASYDFNSMDDYSCQTTYCRTSVDREHNVAWIMFSY
jgi:hypothetical protein